MFNSRVPNRKRIIRTRLKRHNFGIFQFVIFARRQPCCIFRTKICSKFYPFQVTEFLENRFLVAQGKNGGNPCRIAEYFNTAKTEIRLSKSEFGLLPFGYPAKRINIKIIIYFFNRKNPMSCRILHADRRKIVFMCYKKRGCRRKGVVRALRKSVS